MYFQEFHLAANIYNAVLGWYKDCFSRSKRTLLIGCRQLAFTLQPYQYDETIFDSSLNRNGLIYVINTGGEIRAVHQFYGLVFMLCIMSAVVRIYAVVNGFGSFHGVQLSTVTVLIAAIEVVNAISHITCLLNLSQETSRPNSVDAPGRQEEYIVLRHLILRDAPVLTGSLEHQ